MPRGPDRQPRRRHLVDLTRLATLTDQQRQAQQAYINIRIRWRREICRARRELGATREQICNTADIGQSTLHHYLNNPV